MTTTIGLLGGTFDPPHLGHLVVADQVRSELGFDEVWLMVAHDPWQKDPAHGGARVVTPSALRLEMCAAAVAGIDGLVASAVEIELGGETSTARTLEHLTALRSEVRWSVIVGSDVAAGLATWRRSDWLAGNARFVVVDRPHELDGPPPPQFDCRHVVVPRIGVSSSDLRARVADGRSTRFLCPDPVREIIDRHRLYRPDGPISITS